MSPSQCRITLPDAWRQDAVIDAGIVVGTLGDGGQRAAGHHDGAAAEALDEIELFLIGGDHIVERAGGARRQLVGAGAGGKVGALDSPRLGDRAADQLPGVLPSRNPCRAAKCPSPRRCGSRATRDDGERPSSRPNRPRRRAHGSVMPKRIGDDMGRGIGDARLNCAPARRLTGCADQGVAGAMRPSSSGKVERASISSAVDGAYNWNVPKNQDALCIWPLLQSGCCIAAREPFAGMTFSRRSAIV